jgi:hypothetical protein
LWRGTQDFDAIRKLLQAGRNQVVDEIGLDWWELISVSSYPELMEAVLVVRLAAELDPATELYATWPGWPASGVALLLKRALRTFPGTRRSSPFRRYGDLLRRFSFDQLAEIFLDKHDPRYRWRAPFAAGRRGRSEPVVLLPSAYTNVSRVASAYASMVPEQSFLLVATRRSGTHFDSAPNVACTNLAAYARGPEPHAEYQDVLRRWQDLKQRLAVMPEFDLLFRSGLLENFPNYFRDGLAVRNAWRNVLSKERVVAVLCGDDSNSYTRLPVLLARQQGIPTLDFHHGAMDGRFLLKELSSDLYLAKGEMERDYLLRVCHQPADRVIVAGPPLPRPIPAPDRGKGKDEDKDKDKDKLSLIVFFSEPYLGGSSRTEAIYREVLRPLARLARESGRKLVVKLHPFESRPERIERIRGALPPDEAALVEVVAGPFTPELVARAWFAVTIESSTVIDCSLQGVPCFLCQWLSFSPYGYTRQYARFGVGRILESPLELDDVPRILTEPVVPLSEDCLVKPMDADWFRRIVATSAGARGSDAAGTVAATAKVPSREAS